MHNLASTRGVNPVLSAHFGNSMKGYYLLQSEHFSEIKDDNVFHTICRPADMVAVLILI